MVFGGTFPRDKRRGLQPDTPPHVETVGLDGPSLDLFAKLDVSINGLAHEMQTRQRYEMEQLRAIPRNIAFGKMSSPGAATTDIQDFGGPQNGREWDVLLIAAYASPLAANAAVVTWYIGQNSGGPAAGMLPSTMARWQFPSVPNQEDFGAGILKVRQGEHLIAGLTGIPASSNIGLIAVINDQPLYGGSPVAVV